MIDVVPEYKERINRFVTQVERGWEFFEIVKKCSIGFYSNLVSQVLKSVFRHLPVRNEQDGIVSSYDRIQEEN